MIYNTLEIILNCKNEAQAHMQTASFMRSIGAYESMAEQMHSAMDWALHIDLLRQVHSNETRNGVTV